MEIVYKDLGIVVDQALSGIGPLLPLLKKNLANKLHISLHTIGTYIHYWKLGEYYGTSSNNPNDPQSRLNILSIFLYPIFHKDAEMQRNVIAGLREIAEKNGYTFEYPPPEEKRISYGELMKQYEAISNNEPQTSKPENGIKSIRDLPLDERVRYLHNMEISRNPDRDYKLGVVIKREVKITSCKSSNNPLQVGFVLGVMPETSEDGSQLHSAEYTYSIGGSVRGKSYNEMKEVIEFIMPHVLQRADIVYSLQMRGGIRSTTLHMINPIESDTLLIRDGAKRDGINLMLYPKNNLNNLAS